MKLKTIRNLHRDLGYFYLGLIISFASSGIMMNHREYWHPEKYNVDVTPLKIIIPNVEIINDEYVDSLGKALGLNDKVRRHAIKKNALKISFENHDIEIDLKTGKGEMVAFQKTPLISQAMLLHKNTSNWWVYYADIFGLALITISITGAFMIPVGKFSFANRGWKLTCIGLLFPILFLFLFC